MAMDQRMIEMAEYSRFQRRREADNERLALNAKQVRQVQAMFFIYLAELLAAASAAIILRT